MGAVVNASFGSIIELTFYITALIKGSREGNKCYEEIVKSALTGTLLGCVLLVPVSLAGGSWPGGGQLLVVLPLYSQALRSDSPQLTSFLFEAASHASDLWDAQLSGGQDYLASWAAMKCTPGEVAQWLGVITVCPLFLSRACAW